MPATASTTNNRAWPARWSDVSLFDRRHVVTAWTVWGLGCVIAMYLRPGQETVPYHLGWAGFALAFGLGIWSTWQLVVSLTWYTLASGLFLARSWWVGNVGWDETTEIPLMLLLAFLMVWHVRRRQAALADVTKLAEREVQACLDREQLMQLTSHELRTPLTIARGYLELLQSRATELENKQDLAVVFDELQRLSRVSDRLIRMIRLQDDTTTEIVDIDHVMAEAVERWRVVADRRWILDARAGRDIGSPERLRTGLDTLVENAIRYTSEGDTIRVVGSRDRRNVVVGVFDSGAGLTEHQIAAINAGEESPLLPTTQDPATATDATTDTDAATDAADTARDGATECEADTKDDLSGTGLGLSIVRALANARGGTLHASRAPDGGAAMILTFPLDTPGVVGPFVPRLASETTGTQSERRVSA